MTQNGWIKLSRKMLSWRWYQDLNTKALFIHLLLTANIEDTDYKKITVHRGELATTCGRLAAELGLSDRNIRTALQHLKATGEVSVNWYSKFIVISITNYSAYQGGCQATEQATEGPTVRQPRRQVQSLLLDKEIKNKEREKAAVAATPIESSKSGWVTYRWEDLTDDDDDE